MSEWQMRGKEASPAETLEKINGIYQKLGLTVSVQEYESGVKNCYSCRVTVDGALAPYIGSNGKGMSRELCLASANGEMLERLANRTFASSPRLDDDRPEDFSLPYPSMSLTDDRQEECVRALRERLAATVKTPLFMMTPLKFVDSLLERIIPCDGEKRFPTLPFYSMRKKKMTDLPIGLFFPFITSNGLAAGNTYEEALVEGISEILERYAQVRIMDGGIVPPEIPDEVIDRYPHIREVIRDIEKDPRYKVRVLDCSLGKGLPVVCGVTVNRETGTFGMKFGCHPDMAIALERVFTEAFQGLVLDRFTQNNTPDFTAASPGKRKDKWNSIKVGFGSIAAELLMDEPSYAPSLWKDMTDVGNREKMFMLIDLLEALGGDVYIRDAGYLGFPAVQIYAAGVSETVPVDLQQLKLLLLAHKVQRAFLHLDRLTQEEAEDIALFAACKEGAALENKIPQISGLFFKGEMPGAPFEAEFLHAAADYCCGRAASAAERLRAIDASKEHMSPSMAKFVRAARLYAEGIGSGTEESRVYAVVSRLCPENAARVREIFSDPKQCLAKLYPNVGTDKPMQADPTISDYAAIHDFYALLVRQEREHPADPAVITKVLERNI